MFEVSWLSWNIYIFYCPWNCIMHYSAMITSGCQHRLFKYAWVIPNLQLHPELWLILNFIVLPLMDLHPVFFPDGHLVCLCEGSKCLQDTQCHGTQCYASVKVESSGLMFERGCLKGPENVRLQCSTPPTFKQAILCCSQDNCNGNTTRSLLTSLLPSGHTAAHNNPRRIIMSYNTLSWI